MEIDSDVLLEMRLWNIDQMRLAKKRGDEAAAWRFSNNAERLLSQITAADGEARNDIAG